MQSRIKAEERDRMYRFYMTEAMRLGYGLNLRYSDLISDSKTGETRTPDEIIDNLKAKLDSMKEE